MDRKRVIVLVVRGLWATLPLTSGPALGDALATAGRPVQVVAEIGLWTGWAIGLVTALVPTTVSLTVLRLLAPCPLAAAVASTIVEPGLEGAIAIAVGAVIVGLTLRGEVGQVFVQGSAYGEEVRFPLRPPGTLVAGPLPVLWGVLAGTTAAGPLLLAAGHWAWGAVLTLLAVGLLAVLPRRFHRLSRRFLVFVPSGVAIHDHVVLVETAMFRWRSIRSITRALAGTEAIDLTDNALGPALEIALIDAEPVVRTGLRLGEATTVSANGYVCSPTLLADSLAEATRLRRV
jgi:hypothetical protein